ncbi:MAG: response regulator, partial [candidate division NC10 bacterium]|nr:response regulator [candidate division NC10 bacterium]
GEAFDVVLLDYRLPDVEGLQLLRDVISTAPDVPVLMVTGSGDHDVAVAALKTGATDYVIKKPGHLNRLPSAIREALGRFRHILSRRAAGLRVLYAEHDPVDLDLTLRHLATHAPHLQVETVGTGASTLQRLEAGKYDLVLLDYRMPGLNGLEVLQEMREQRIRVPVVMVTGHGDEATAVQALKLGALDYIVKREGYLQQLPSTIENAIAQRALEDERAALLILNGLATLVASTLDLGELLDRVTRAATALLWVDHSLVSRLSDDGVELIPVAWHGIPDELASRLRFRVGQDVPGQVVARQRAVNVRDIRQEDVTIFRKLAVLNGIGGVLGAPMRARGKLFGVLTVAAIGPRAFTAMEESLLTALAAHAAVGIENAQLLAEVKRHAVKLEERVQERTRELVSANQQLETASRHKSELLANMSHELRTPLSSILGFSELLQDPDFDVLTEKRVRFAQHIKASGEHLLSLINDLLDLSKIEAGKIELRPEPFECREAVYAAVTEIQLQADRKHLALELRVDEAPSTLTADPVCFKQILLNLLSNAVKFTPDGGQIMVTARVGSRGEGLGSSEGSRLDPKPYTLYPGECVEIAVADTGIGIKPEDLPRLFQEFVRLDAATALRTEGTGLGLALTRKLVELHGGTIAAVSEGEGRGSTFTVRLPITLSSQP